MKADGQFIKRTSEITESELRDLVAHIEAAKEFDATLGRRSEYFVSHRCAHCGEDAIVFEKTPALPNIENSECVIAQCAICCASAPPAATEAGALSAWRVRARRPESAKNCE